MGNDSSDAAVDSGKGNHSCIRTGQYSPKRRHANRPAVLVDRIHARLLFVLPSRAEAQGSRSNRLIVTEPCTICSGLTAMGTIVVAILAIWGDWFRSRFASPHVEVHPHNLRGTVTRFSNGPRVIYYHLKAVNTRKWATARDCRVILTSLYVRGPDNRFQSVPLPVPPQFVWAPAESTPAVVDISGEHVCDFGRVIEGKERFEPLLYSSPNNFAGFVTAGGAIRYQVQAFAQGSSLGPSSIYEVASNGKWSDNLDVMSHNLTITLVSNNSS